MLFLLPLVLLAQMEINATPSSLNMAFLQGDSGSTGFSIANSGAVDHDYALFVMPEALINAHSAYYPFNGFYDDLFTRTTGTLANLSFADDRLERPEHAVHFNGYGSYITREFALENDFSISFWAKPTATQPMYTEGYYNSARYCNYLLVPEWGGTNNWGGFGIGLGTNGIMLIEHGHAYMPVMLSWSADLSAWHHYTITFANHAPKLYIDGVLVRSGITSQRTYTRLSNEFGQTGYGSYTGFLDELSVFGSALDPATINVLYAYDGFSRYSLAPMLGTLGSAENQTVTISLLDYSLPLGDYTDTLCLCQGGASPEHSVIPIYLNITDLAPLAPNDVSISNLGTHEVLLQWTAVTHDTHGNPFSPTNYHIYRSDKPGPIWNYYEVGQTSGTVFHDMYDPLENPPAKFFYYIRAE